jgi:DNA replication protein DnaC
LIIDFFCLQPLDATETSDLVVERHHRASTVVTSNRDPSEWLTVMADALLAQSAIDRKRAPHGSSSSRVLPVATERSQRSRRHRSPSSKRRST